MGELKETIGIFAHVDAGKTTLSEMMLYKSGVIRNAGRVDDGNTCMDYNRVEKSRGITIYSAFASFTWKNARFYLIDTPGHKDFSEEIESALCVLDKAVLVVSAVEGIQSYTEKIWEYLKELGIPVVVFINKTDRMGASVERVEQELKMFSRDCRVLTEENVAERDEEFLELYLSECFTAEDYKRAARRSVRERKLFPVICGAALKGEGVEELLDILAFLCDRKYDSSGDFGGIVWKIRYDGKGVRWTDLKVTSGRLFPRMELPLGKGQFCKAGELRSFQGEKSVNLKEASAGDICTVSGIVELAGGDVIGNAANPGIARTDPVLASRMVEKDGTDIQNLYSAVKILSEENPSLRVDRTGKQIIFHINGTVQLEVLPEIIKDRFGFDVNFEEPEVIYKETITAPVMGYGHYEPLKHYSEVHLRLEPQPRGSGISFASECPLDTFGQRWQNLVKSHVFERKHAGVLTGSELTDVKIVLVAGKEHYLHTSGGDFRQATYRAIRQGLMKSSSRLLEPVHQVRFTVDTGLAGAVINRIAQMGGELEQQAASGGYTAITAWIPVIEMLGYVTEFAALTHGKGSVSILKSDWRFCHNEPEVIEAKGYIAENDLEQPADSVFCRKGVARLIKYSQVESQLHIPLDLRNFL